MTYSFEMPSQQKSIIKVMGVGGGGGNAVNFMYQQGIKGVEFLVCNTDNQALQTSTVPNKLQIGSGGLGVGNQPEKGKQAALEDKDKIADALQGAKMLFVTAGMGGGTGTGAAPVIARISKEMGILTVGIVTLPFTFEGKKKRELAEAGIAELKQYCDTVILVVNDKIRELFSNLGLKQAFAQADNILTTAAKSIAEIITNPGMINIDFEDVIMVMKDAGDAVMGSAIASGENRALKAAEMALNSPLLNNTDIKGAKKILVSITVSDPDAMTIDEYGIINDYLQAMAGDALLKPGVSIDPNLAEEDMMVTVIATGFDSILESKPTQPEANTQATEISSGLIQETTVIDLGNEIVMTKSTPSFASMLDDLADTRAQYEREESKVLETSQGIFAKQEESKVVINLDENIYARQQTLFPEEPLKSRTVDFQNMEVENRKDALTKQYEDRRGKLQELSSTYSNMQPEDFKNRLDVPAYERKKRALEEVPHSSERIISRFNLNEDNEILGNNKFLFDNVD